MAPADGQGPRGRAQVRYSAKGEQLEDRSRSNQTAYAVFDPESGRWTRWRRLEMPPGDEFNFARSACAQFVVEPDGSVLLPFYIGRSADTPYSVTVVRCTFDGDALTYREHGDVLKLDVVRGLCEPSLARSGGRYFLTIRNDLKGYVTVGDGLHYRPIKAWTFDDGQELGSYNTQQHWLAHGDGLFLVYTRRGANNDHIARHRAPLFIAQVDPRRLCVIRETERVLIPERGGEFGNFGAAAIDDGSPGSRWPKASGTTRPDVAARRARCSSPGSSGRTRSPRPPGDDRRRPSPQARISRIGLPCSISSRFRPGISSRRESRPSRWRIVAWMSVT